MWHGPQESAEDADKQGDSKGTGELGAWRESRNPGYHTHGEAALRGPQWYSPQPCPCPPAHLPWQKVSHSRLLPRGPSAQWQVLHQQGGGQRGQGGLASHQVPPLAGNRPHSAHLRTMRPRLCWLRDKKATFGARRGRDQP